MSQFILGCEIFLPHCLTCQRMDLFGLILLSSTDFSAQLIDWLTDWLLSFWGWLAVLWRKQALNSQLDKWTCLMSVCAFTSAPELAFGIHFILALPTKLRNFFTHFLLETEDVSGCFSFSSFLITTSRNRLLFWWSFDFFFAVLSNKICRQNIVAKF